MRSTWHIAAVVAAVLAAVVGVAVAVVALTGGRARVAGPEPPATVTAPATTPSAAPSRSAVPTGAPATSRPGSSAAPTTGPATPAVPRGLLGKDVEVLPTTRPVVALTFDAGSNADGLPAILRTLAAERVTGTFFLTGDFATRHPESVRALVAAAGHRLGNHSATHPYFTKLSDDAIRAELAGGQRRILSAGGTDPRPLFRFPYGDRNARTIATVNAAGYVAVRWTVDTLGWKGTSGGITAQTVVDRTVAGARPGEIVLMHVGSHPDDRSTLDADALPAVITQLRAKGYGFTTLEALR